jgi:hypothetical protein
MFRSDQWRTPQPASLSRLAGTPRRRPSSVCSLNSIPGGARSQEPRQARLALANHHQSQPVAGTKNLGALFGFMAAADARAQPRTHNPGLGALHGFRRVGLTIHRTRAGRSGVPCTGSIRDLARHDVL